MRVPSAIRRFVTAACAALCAGVWAFGPDASSAELVSAVDLRYQHSPGRAGSWHSSLALASPAAEFGLAPAGLLTSPGLAGARRDAPRATAAARADQLALQIRAGPSRWHGSLAELRADWRRSVGGVGRDAWFSLGAIGVARSDATVRFPLIGFGGSARWRRLEVTARVDQTQGYGARRIKTYSVEVPEESTTVVYTSIAPARLTTVTRMQMSAGCEWRGIALGAAGGLVMGSGFAPRRWMRGSAAVRVLPAVSMFGSYGGTQSGLFAGETPGRPEAAMGVRVTPAPLGSAGTRGPGPLAVRSWRLRQVGEGGYRFIVRAHGANAVELMGDMTDWQPIPLERAGASAWEATLVMTPGVHQILVRLEGGTWEVPPRMTSTESEFAGRVGILVVE